MENEYGLNSSCHLRRTDLPDSRIDFLRIPKRKRGSAGRAATRRAPYELSFPGAAGLFRSAHRLRLVALPGETAPAGAPAQCLDSGTPGCSRGDTPGGAGIATPTRLDDIGTGHAFCPHPIQDRRAPRRTAAVMASV